MPIPNLNVQPPKFSENWPASGYHPTDQRFAGGMTGARGNQALAGWQQMMQQYQQAPQFDANSIGRGIDQSYFNSIALQPSVASNLKGMGVGAAEGQAALMQSLPLMQARAEGKANLSRDQYQAQQGYLMNLANMLNQMNQLGLGYEQIFGQHLDRWANIDLNK